MPWGGGSHKWLLQNSGLIWGHRLFCCPRRWAAGALELLGSVAYLPLFSTSGLVLAPAQPTLPSLSASDTAGGSSPTSAPQP